MADAITELKPIQEISPAPVKPALLLPNTFTQVDFNKLGIQPGESRQALQAIAENKPVGETAKIAKGREDEYLAHFNPKNRDALRTRYEDVRTEKQNVITEMKAFAKEKGISKTNML